VDNATTIITARKVLSLLALRSLATYLSESQSARDVSVMANGKNKGQAQGNVAAPLEQALERSRCLVKHTSREVS